MQCARKIIFVDKSPATYIQQERSWLHRLKKFTVHKLFVAFIERTMQGHDIGSTKACFHVGKHHAFHSVPFRMLMYCLNLHPKSKRNCCDSTADFSQSHDTHGQSMKFYHRFFPIAKVGLGSPVSLLHTFGVKTG